MPGGGNLLMGISQKKIANCRIAVPYRTGREARYLSAVGFHGITSKKIKTLGVSQKTSSTSSTGHRVPWGSRAPPLRYFDFFFFFFYSVEIDRYQASRPLR